MKEYENLKIYSEILEMGENYITKKDVVKNFPHNFMSKKLEYAIKNREVEYTTTSGTTSDRMQIVRKKNWWLDEYKRTYKNNDKLTKVLDEKKNKAILTTAVCSNSVCYLDTPSFEERIINGTLYLNLKNNPWSWDYNDIMQMNEEIEKFETYYLDVDPVYFYIFLFKCKEYGIKYVDFPKVITLSYEFCPQYIPVY